MQTSRLTVLMTPDRKSDIEARASKMGVSSGEYIRLAVDNFEDVSAEQEAELAALVAQANLAIPKMRASLERSSATLAALHEEMDAFLREKGIRK
jgi:hypothetical protein